MCTCPCTCGYKAARKLRAKRLAAKRKRFHVKHRKVRAVKPEVAKQVRFWRALGVRERHVARHFDIGVESVRRIVKRMTHRDIDKPENYPNNGVPPPTVPFAPPKPKRKFTVEQVRWIRHMYETKQKTVTAIAKAVGAKGCLKQIRWIAERQTYRDIDSPIANTVQAALDRAKQFEALPMPEAPEIRRMPRAVPRPETDKMPWVGADWREENER